MKLIIKKKQLYVIKHLINDNKRIIPIEHLKDAVDILFYADSTRNKTSHSGIQENQRVLC
jgi:hypothetical protein